MVFGHWDDKLRWALPETRVGIIHDKEVSWYVLPKTQKRITFILLLYMQTKTQNPNCQKEPLITSG
jgi:hypothetical protein